MNGGKRCTELKKPFPPQIVGLTATPPYDVTGLEWNRYISMNGDIDAEITVPELIQAGDLCPHQDYLFATFPSREEVQEIQHFRKEAEVLFNWIRQEENLIIAIKNHPFVLEPVKNEVLIYENLGFYAACLIFLSANGQEIPIQNYELFGISQDNQHVLLPPLDFEWMETLLSNFLFDQKGYFSKKHRELQQEILKKLKHAGIVDRRMVRFENQELILKYLSNSVSKLNGIAEIVEFEYQQLGKQLRQVILSDYVRKEYLVQTPQNELELRKVGVLSIFEKLRRQSLNEKRLGVLTGTLVILPNTALSSFQQHCLTLNPHVQIPTQTLAFDLRYTLIPVNDSIRDLMVQVVTNLFEKGEIEVLIGTKALLGEGWDAPAINSLVLASVVGSFVSSNQMRGRAIRQQLSVPEKTSNIWHLVSLDPTRNYRGQELEVMRRRFKNFVGVSELSDGGISNGLERINFPMDINHQSVRNFNEETFKLAADRSRLKAQWYAAIGKGVQLLEEIKIPNFEPGAYPKVKAAQMQKTIRNMVGSLTASIAFYLEWSTQAMLKLNRMFGVNGSYLLTLVFAVAAVFFGWRTIKAFFYYSRYRDITLDIYQIGNALLKTLCEARIFQTQASQLKVLTYADQQGAVYCHLDGGNSYEKALFVQMIQEIVDPIDNPRYIIVRKSRALKVFYQQDYHAVPELLGRKSALANAFAKHWTKEVGNCDLFFTRYLEGRRRMMKSKMFALANHFSPDAAVQRVNVWR